MKKDEDPREEFIYRVVEEIDGKLEGEVTAGVDWLDGQQIDLNKRKRFYTHLPTAQAYRNRLRKRGREAKILRFVYESTIN